MTIDSLPFPTTLPNFYLKWNSLSMDFKLIFKQFKEGYHREG